MQVYLDYEVPTPFGDTYSFQQPVVAGTNVSSVESGASFIINGSGFYPSLVRSVELGGNDYTSSQFTVLSDTQIQMTATSLCGDRAIVVQTQVGRSNSDQTIYIDYL